MAPARAHGVLRGRLVEAGVKMLEAGGPQALQARRLTAEVGTSTQAIYTHFGGMPGLLEAIVADSLNDFAAHVLRISETDDPIADFFARGWAYCEWALNHPQLYRLIFGLSGELRPDARIDMTPGGKLARFAEGHDAFDVLVGSLARVVASGRIRQIDPVLVAGQYLSATHGYVLLEMAEVFGHDSGGFDVVEPLAINLMVGLGDRRRAAERSWQSALSRIAALPSIS